VVLVLINYYHESGLGRLSFHQCAVSSKLQRIFSLTPNSKYTTATC